MYNFDDTNNVCLFTNVSAYIYIGLYDLSMVMVFFNALILS